MWLSDILQGLHPWDHPPCSGQGHSLLRLCWTGPFLPNAGLLWWVVSALNPLGPDTFSELHCGVKFFYPNPLFSVLVWVLDPHHDLKTLLNFLLLSPYLSFINIPSNKYLSSWCLPLTRPELTHSRIGQLSLGRRKDITTEGARA